MKGLIKVKTIEERHVNQLPLEHYWDGEYDFHGKEIIGRLMGCGSILLRDNGVLHRIGCVAYVDWWLEILKCRWRVNGKWVYAETPHTDYTRRARLELEKLPQLFLD